MAGFSSTVRQVGVPQPPKPKAPFGPGYLDAAGKWHAPGSFTGSSPPPYAPPAAPTHAIRPGPTGPSTAPVPEAPRPGAPGQTPGTSATTTAPPATQPYLDATALNNIATNQFKANNSINTIQNRSIPNLQAGLAAQMAQYNLQQPRDALTLEQNANRRGALYSSVYQQQDLPDLIQKYLTNENTATTNEGQQEQGLKDQIQAILGEIPLYNQGQSAAAVQRAIAAAAANPATGQPPSLTPDQIKYINAGTKPPGAAPSAKPSGSITGNRWQRGGPRLIPPPKPRVGVVGTSNFGRR